MTRFLDSLASTLAGMLIATLMLAIAAPDAFVWSAAPRSAPESTFSPAPARPEQPDTHPGAPTAGQGSRPDHTPSPTIGKRPASTEAPRTAVSLRGIASFVAPSYGARYLALPDGPGHRVTICSASACVVRTSTDAGPDRAMQRAGRVADLSWADFRSLCGCDPWVRGLLRVVVTPVPAPPETSLEDTP